MTRIGEIYRGVILRSVFGAAASELKVADLERLNQLCEHLAQCEEAQTALRARGYGRAGMTFLEIVREVPVNALGRIKNWFGPSAAAKPRQAAEEMFDIWSSR